MPVGIKVLLFDIGGVLLSNGWETASRKQAADDFGLDASDFEQRHQAVSDEFETGKLSLDGYLTRTVFYEERPFARDDFVRFMQQQSEPYPESLDLVRRLARTREYLIATLNNESRELNDYANGSLHGCGSTSYRSREPWGHGLTEALGAIRSAGRGGKE